MSQRDEQLAADYLRKHGEYDPNDNRRGPKNKWLMGVLFVVLLALGVMQCRGEIVTITTFGYFDEADDLEYWGLETLWPVPYLMTVEMDTDAVDQDPYPDLGVYKMASGRVTLTFDGYGDYYWDIEGTVVKIWNGRWGLKGIGFGNSDEFSAYGVNCAAETGIYSALLVPSSWPGVTITSDSLQYLFDLQNNTVLQGNGYSYLYGIRDDTQTEVALLDHTVSYSVE